MSKIYDVIIVGAGPGGSTAGHYLSQRGHTVLLLDKADFPRDKTCGDGLPPRALPVLQDMGIFDEVMTMGCRLDILEITSPAGKSVTVPIPGLPNAPSYAVIVPRLKLDHLILERAIRSGAEFQGSVHVSNIERDENGIVVKIQDGDAVSGRMAVIATGASSKLLSNMGFVKERPSTIVAARAYFENIAGLPKRFHFCFSGVTLPGYGWVFPTSDDSANVGTGFIVRNKRRNLPASPRTAFDTFVQDPVIKSILSGAKQAGPVKGYPLRTDFSRSPTYGRRVLLVGESAGLVNPLTGDGIDYALESGKIAAEHIIKMFAAGDFSPHAHQEYDHALRQRYQNLFRYCERIQRYCLNRRALNVLIPAAGTFPEVAKLLVMTVLGGKEVPAKISPLTLVKALVTHR